MNEQYEIEFDKIGDSITWYPYIGKYYAKSDFKILMVGESHYKNPDDPREIWKSKDFTRVIVGELGVNMDFYNNIKFFKQINQLFNWNGQEFGIWNQAAFYNFIQRPLATKHDRPSKTDFLTGWKSFEKIIEILKPNLCVFLGSAAANTFNESFAKGNKVDKTIKWHDNINRTYLKTSSLINEDMETNLIFIKHPSQYISLDKWREKLVEFHPEIKAHLANQ
ncbi:uracil-DNA glycosylase family protein [Sphingobacterium siyangense]|uniref:uracil-DNA glycosylase family protein n=1 Tax=Sphingobacterium siyangense TaxID=459529 RepID=UPI003DA3A08E